MLKEFRVSNFKSIVEEQSFTMESSPKNVVSEYPGHVLEIGQNRLLKVASIYGPNGGGKTNLLKALQTFVIVTTGTGLINDSIKEENYFPSLFAKGKNTKFTIFLVEENCEIGYSLEVDLNNVMRTSGINSLLGYVINYRIVNEEMVFKYDYESSFTELFKRDDRGLVTSNVLSEIDLIKNKRLLNNNSTFVKYFCSLFDNNSDILNSEPIFNFFRSINSIYKLSRETSVFRYLEKDVELLRPHLKTAKIILNSFDFRINNIYFKEIDSGVFSLYINKTIQNGDSIDIPLSNESKGTIKAVNIVLDILSKNNSSVFVADDFDSFLHPKIVRAIIELFTDEKNRNKQLIFNSHDMINMNNQVFRRDEIWFAYRDDNFFSRYIPLTNIVDFKGNMVRKDAVYGKQYLEGRYGADPFIKKGMRWNHD